jgi:hypothetical protein
LCDNADEMKDARIAQPTKRVERSNGERGRTEKDDARC